MKSTLSVSLILLPPSWWLGAILPKGEVHYTSSHSSPAQLLLHCYNVIFLTSRGLYGFDYKDSIAVVNHNYVHFLLSNATAD